MVNVELLKNTYFINGFDVPYRLSTGKEINIKPILLKDAVLYDFSKEIFLIRKNEISDIEIIQMSYLEFLMRVEFQRNEMAIEQLKSILHLCLGENYITLGKYNGKYSIGLCNENGEVENIISPKDFDDISKIILNQNDPNYDNRYVNPEVRQMMAEYYSVKYKDISSPSLEKRKAFVCSKTGKTFFDLNEIPYREFELIYKACLDSEIYLATKVTEASYKYEVKEQAKHPLFERDKDPYEEIFEDTSTLSSKGISGAEQLNAMNFQK